MEGKVQLGYWEIRGLSERIRMIMEYLSIPYEMVNYNQENREKWFNEIKPELIKKNPAITLPYLIDGDKLISESDAVCVYLVHRAGKAELLGRNADEQVRLATVAGVVKDLHPKYVELVYGRYGEKDFEDAKKEYLEKFQPYMVKLNSLIEGKDYYCGEITWLDFAVAEFMQTLWLLDAGFVEGFGNVQNHWKRVWDLPAIKAYHESDRFKERPCNNYMAKWK